jgi:hypothetical protein
VIILQAPFSAPVTTLNLPNPQLGDSETRNNRVKIGVTMSGKIITTVSIQPGVKLQYSFNNLKRVHIAALTTFLNTQTDIKLTDWTGTIWRVKCLSNPVEYTEGIHFYTCQLDFHGVKV